MNAPQRGLIVHVLRPAEGGDTTNGGVTSRFAQFVLIGDGLPEIFEPDARLPALRLVRRRIGDRQADYAVPTDHPEGLAGPMFGGNFVHTSDGRFGRDPLPVHDRFETWAQHDALSR